MRPVTTGKYISDSVIVYSVLFCYISHIHTIFSFILYCLNVIFTKLCSPMIRTARYITTSFIKTVLHIVKLSSNKEMFRINATRIVTSMENTKGFIKTSVMNLIRKSMSAISFFSYGKRAITVTFPYGSSVNPARFCFVNLGKKSINMMLCNHVIDGITFPFKGEELCQL